MISFSLLMNKYASYQRTIKPSYPASIPMNHSNILHKKTDIKSAISGIPMSMVTNSYPVELKSHSAGGKSCLILET